MRIGINGFGRIGRALYRVNNLDPDINIVIVNDINPDKENIFYTLKYDTLYGIIDDVSLDNGYIINSRHNNKTKIVSNKNINEVNWSEYNLDYIVDSSGVVKSVQDSKKLIDKKVIKKVFCTFSPDIEDFTMVLGANENDFDVLKHNLISTSICDASALAPALKVINDLFEIKNGYVTTLHPLLSYQNLLDGPSSSWAVPGDIYHHYALGRSIIGNLIPKPTTALDVALKSINGIDSKKMGCFSYRTPTSIVCSADLSLTLKKKSSKSEIIDLFTDLQKKQKFNIFQNVFDPLVSLDFLRTSYSCNIDHRWTDVLDNNLLKLVFWYDNEWGYATRVIDIIKYVDSKTNE
tara:strand:- start:198 stop:1244 length:1047 start_codon:yes stop_codon:yes gene_type:complete